MTVPTSTRPAHRGEPSDSVAVTTAAVLHFPPADVFDFLAHLENNPRWNWAIVSTEPLTDGPTRAGSRFLQTRSSPRRAREVLEVAAHDAGRLLEIVTRADGTMATYRYELEPLSAQRARVAVRAELRPDHPIGRSHLYRARAEATLRASLDELAGALGEESRRVRP